jgi:hypothetical protein
MSTSFRFVSFLASALSLASLVACGGSAGTVGDGDDPNAPPPSGSGTGQAGEPGAQAPGTEPPGTPGAAANGPQVVITMSGTTAPFKHADGFAGETPKTQIVAVRSLYLLRHPTDPNPVKVYEHAPDKAVEVDVVSGKTVELARVAAKSLPAGVYTVARSGVSYVRYSVAARMHTPLAVDGQYDNVQALSDGAVVDTVKRNKGWFRYSFGAGGTTYGTLEGEDAPTPVATTGGGISMDMSGPETFYVFPVQVAIDPNVSVDHEAHFEVNVDKSFRWQDQALTGYTTNVFDTTPSSFEPVMAFGANSFNLTVAPKK